MINEFYCIRINLLGEFKLSTGNIVITSSDLSNQLTSLICYIAAHRNTYYSEEGLIEALWSDQSSNPTSALKNLIYRFRKILKDKDFPYAKDLIISSMGTYKLNPDLSYDIDTEQLEAASKKAEAEHDDDARIHEYLELKKYYHGEFMQNSSQQDWVLPYKQYYHSLFFSNMYSLLDLYHHHERFDDMMTIAKDISQFDKYEEQAHRYIMFGLAKEGSSSKAISYYNEISAMFYNNLNMELSAATKELYYEIAKTSKINNTDILSIRDEFMENNEDVKQALYSEFEVLKQLYRFEARVAERTKSSIFLGLLTITSIDNKTIEKTLHDKAMATLKSSILSSLRKGDVFSRCSANQFVIMLPTVNFSNGTLVLERIEHNFRSNFHSRKVIISHNLEPVGPNIIEP